MLTCHGEDSKEGGEWRKGINRSPQARGASRIGVDDARYMGY